MHRRLSSTLGIAVLVAVTGCSGAESSDLFGPEANGGATNDTPAASSDGTDPAPPSATAPSKTDTPPTADDPGSAPGTDPQPPKPTCAAESLDNDELRSADSFDSCIAGKLVGKDVDYVSIVAPADAKEVIINHTESGGKVSYRLYVNGFTSTFTDVVPDSIPAMPNAKYTFKVEPSGTTTGDRAWQLEVSFQ